MAADWHATIVGNYRTMTLLASITTTYFVYGGGLSSAQLAATTWTLGAYTVTAQKYNVSANAVVATYGVTLPGNAAGATATGGQYI